MKRSKRQSLFMLGAVIVLMVCRPSSQVAKGHDETMKRKNSKSLFVGCLVLLAAICFRAAGNPGGEVRLAPPADPIPRTLFGMHIHHLATRTPWPGTKFGAIRLWDSYAAWPDVEPEKGKWNFAGVDKYVAQAEQNGVEVLLPLGLSPTWASARPEEKSSNRPGNAAPAKNIDDWREYVSTIATRYKGRVHYYEIWNEPNLKDFYTGSIPQLVEVARIASTTLKEVDPTNLVSSPPFTGVHGVNSLDQYLQAGGGKYVDVIGYHFYVNPAEPEQMVQLIQNVKNVLAKYGQGGKPLWDTETGWAIQNTQSEVKPAPGKGFNSVVLSQEEASAYIARTYVLAWATGVSRLYWYAWDNGVMGLADADGKTAKPPAKAYGIVEDWLVGAKMLSCTTDLDGSWVAELSRPGNYHGWIVWNPTRTLNSTPPAYRKVKQVRDLAGKTEPVNSERPSVTIGPSPVLFESQAP